jgi:hypothetical protein
MKKIHLSRTINFGTVGLRSCSYIYNSNTVDRKTFDALPAEVKCKHCVRESQRRWVSSLLTGRR